MVRSIKNVPEPEPNEPPRRLRPAWIKRGEALVTFEFIGAHHAGRRNEAEHGNDARRQVLKMRTNGKGGQAGPDGIFKKHIEPNLVPNHIFIIG